MQDGCTQWQLNARAQQQSFRLYLYPSPKEFQDLRTPNLPRYKTGYKIVIKIKYISTYPRTHKKMIRQKLQLQYTIHLLETVEFNALVVIYIDPLLLGCCHHELRVQPTDIVNGLHHVYFAMQLLRDPVQRGQVTLSSSQHKVTSVSSELHSTLI